MVMDQCSSTTTPSSHVSFSQLEVRRLADVQRGRSTFRPVHVASQPALQTISLFDHTESTTLDRHCPIQNRSKFASNRRDSRWLSSDAVEAKRNRRRLERKWKSSRSDVDFIEYRKACRTTNKSIITSRKDFYRQRINEAGENPRTRWSAFRDVLHLANSTEAHSKRECKRLCNNFASYFVEKSRKIKETIKSQLDNTSADPLRSDPMYTGLVLCSLVAPSTDEVRKLINSLPGKSSPMDCIPTTVLKSCVEVFAPLIARLTTLCFD